MAGQCDVKGCGPAERLRRGWCIKHYTRWRRHGSPHVTKKTGPAPLPFDDQVLVTEDGCHEWQGRRDRYGYGRFRGKGAHRVAWERANGRTIPDGLEVDHLCSNPPCVNADHLETVTHQENLLRAGERAREANPEAHAPIDGAPHGSKHSYDYYGCRCERCTAANRETGRATRQSLNARLADDPAVAVHGSSSTYVNWGCRCAPCTAAHSESMETYHAEREVV